MLRNELRQRIGMEPFVDFQVHVALRLDECGIGCTRNTGDRRRPPCQREQIPLLGRGHVLNLPRPKRYSAHAGFCEAAEQWTRPTWTGLPPFPTDVLRLHTTEFEIESAGLVPPTLRRARDVFE